MQFPNFSLIANEDFRKKKLIPPFKKGNITMATHWEYEKSVLLYKYQLLLQCVKEKIFFIITKKKDINKINFD